MMRFFLEDWSETGWRIRQWFTNGSDTPFFEPYDPERDYEAEWETTILHRFLSGKMFKREDLALHDKE
jgi:hypothetical protein